MGMEGLGNNVQTTRQHYRRVDRFVRPGVDVLMERKGLDSASISKAKKGYGRIAYFMASRVQKESLGSSDAANIRKYFRHIDCFISSGIEKGEGYLGGGMVASFQKIGFNPLGKFRELRVKRQSIKEAKKGGVNFCRKMPPPSLDTKLPVDILRIKREQEEAVAAIQANEQQRAREKEEMANERKKDYADIVNYNPWGQPAVGAPKLTKSGKIDTQLYGVNLSASDELKFDMFGMPRKYPQYPGYGAAMKENLQCFKRKQTIASGELLSEFEKKKQLKEKQRREYYINYLEKQLKSEANKPFEGKEKCVPTDFIWGRTEVDRNLSGKLVSRNRQLYTLDHGPVFNKSYQTYFSMADKMHRLPGHYPFRGDVDYSYDQWNKPGANSLMRSRCGKIRPPPFQMSLPSSVNTGLLPPVADLPEDSTKPSLSPAAANRRLSQPTSPQLNVEPSSSRRLSLPETTLTLPPLAPSTNFNIGHPPPDTNKTATPVVLPKQPISSVSGHQPVTRTDVTQSPADNMCLPAVVQVRTGDNSAQVKCA